MPTELEQAQAAHIAAHMTVLGYDDWFGLYRDDELVDQGHSVEVSDIVRASKGAPFTLQRISYEAVGTYLTDHGQFHWAIKLSDVMQAIGP